MKYEVILKVLKWDRSAF